MSTYAIGDIQGCLNALNALLEKIQFDSKKDILWFTGDLVNRGTQSLETLRFIKNLGEQHKIVLGNHDLHLLALAHGAHAGWKEDTLMPILQAKDKDELIAWLLHQPLLHYSDSLNYTMVHAGVAPSWTLEKAKTLAKEIESILQSDARDEFFRHMYGDEPSQWNDSLQQWERLRCITNYFTRARFCYPDGRMELAEKGKHHAELIPWFQIPDRKTQNEKIIFGHWAALGGVTNTPNTFALDTGCIWGYCLTAMRLEDEKRFSVDCKNIK